MIDGIRETVTEEHPTAKKVPWVFLFTLCVGTLAVVLSTLLISLTFLNSPPKSFKASTVVTIEQGMSVRTIAEVLQDAKVIRSSSLLYFVILAFYEPTDIKASTYVFDEPLPTHAVANQLATGDFDNDLIRFTHIEGERATEIANTAETILIDFDKEAFLKRAVPLEGKLYPETYFIPKTYTADELIDLMITTFAKETNDIQTLMDVHSLSYDEILVLASILEREANSEASMKIVSGILQRRLAEGMPLQADASIEYVLNKPLKELTPDDLKIDSPYNTYTNRGLPPTPIGNPGRTAILAVLEPTDTEYIFYITDEEGEFHYAKTYDEHLDNIERYLR
jgi:UPF0755 protein